MVTTGTPRGQGIRTFGLASWPQARYQMKRSLLLRRYMRTRLSRRRKSRSAPSNHLYGEMAFVVASCRRLEHGPAARSALRSLIDPNIIHQQRLRKRRAGIGTSGPLSSDGDVENQIERVVEDPP